MSARVDFAGGSLWTRDQGIAVGSKVRVRVLANDVSLTLDRSERRYWTVRIAAIADGVGAVTVDATTITDVFNTTGAAAWSIAVVGGGDYAVTIEVTGAAATSIAWSAAFEAAAPGTP